MFKNLKKYKLILINKDGLRAREINPLKFSLFALIFSSVLFIFFILSFYSTDINEIISFKTIAKHKSNNEKLHSVISEQEEYINELIKEIEIISERDENLRKLIKLPPIDRDIRKLGVGGGSSNEDILNNFDYLLPYEINLELIRHNINYLKRSVNLENLSYNEIEEETNKNLDKILHYPAIHPISKEVRRFSSGYGYRVDPFTKRRKYHEGHDFSAKVGANVLCTADGIVKTSSRNSSFGNYIEVDHQNGYITIYGHLSKRIVNKGDIVERGEVIGNVGNTGKSTAPHLHYEINYNKKHIDPSNFYYDLSYSN